MPQFLSSEAQRLLSNPFKHNPTNRLGKISRTTYKKKQQNNIKIKQTPQQEAFVHSCQKKLQLQISKYGSFKAATNYYLYYFQDVTD